MTQQPAISVVMAVFNGAKYIQQTIESVINQTYKNFEFIIVDDGSTDNSADIIKTINDKRIKYVWQVNKGISVALNAGIAIAKGMYIARIDADDICNPQRLTKQYNFLEENPDYVVVGSNARVIDKDGKFVFSSNLLLNHTDIAQTKPFYPFYHSSVMIRKQPLKKVGCYNEEVSSLNAFEDLLLWNKLDQEGRFANLKEELISYRLVPGASTSKIGKDAKIVRKIFEQYQVSGKLKHELISELANLKQQMSVNDRLFYYYMYLAKCYLSKNKRPLRFLINTMKAFIISPSVFISTIKQSIIK